MTKKRLSPFSVEFWEAKGFSKEEAVYERNSRRPINWEFWVKTQNMSEEEAKIKAIETKSSNNKKGAKKSAGRSEEELRKSSIRCEEHWLAKGFSIEEAKQKVKEAQALGSLENFIKRYGEKEGTERWKVRQLNWQKTLNDKSEEEKEEINKSKNDKKIRSYETLDECVERCSAVYGMKLFSTLESFESYLCELFRQKPHFQCQPPKRFFEKHVSSLQKDILETFLPLDDVIEKFAPLFKPIDVYRIDNGKMLRRGYSKRVDEGLLRSSSEIYFYNKIKDVAPNVHLELDKNYPDSNFRFDFKVDNIYVEIAPMFGKDKTYTDKMNKKKQLFGCVILTSLDEIDQFIESFIYENHAERHN